MLKNYLIIVFALGSGVLIGDNLRSCERSEQAASGSEMHSLPPITKSPAAQPVPQPSFAVLQRQLQRMTENQAQFEERLEARLMQFEELLAASEDPAFISSNPIDPDPIPEPETPVAEKPSEPTIRSSVEKLMDSGISHEQAVLIQARLDEIDLQQLYLRDQATREGWINEPRFHKERRQYQNAVTELREDIGDHAYDRVLYSLGRANRVVIQDVMQNSSAEQYGLLGSDKILSYDGQRVFSTRELTSLIAQGGAGIMTTIQIQRDNDVHEIYLPRGPLGIRMTAARFSP